MQDNKTDIVLLNTDEDDLKENTETLKQEALQILSELSVTSNEEKQKDLTYLFNQNQNKKAAIAANKCSDLLLDMLDEVKKRVKEHPEEMGTQEMFQNIKTTHEIMEKSSAIINGKGPGTLIQVNNNKTEIKNDFKVDDPRLANLTRDNRKNVDEFIRSCLGDKEDANLFDQDNIIDIETSEKNDE